MIKTIIELLFEWWVKTDTTRMPLPTIYIYEVGVDGRTIQVESMSKSRMHIYFKVRRKYRNAKHIRAVKQTRQY